MEKKLLLGNEAVARGLYEAGVKVVSAYPGTPSTEITEATVQYPEIYSEWAPNEKVAFVGTDAIAKTTFFKILMGEEEADEGTFKWGVTTSQAYFPSDNSEFFDDCDDSLIDWVRNYSDLQFETDVRGWLGRLMFSGEEATKKAKVLSGGEKVRCMLIKMMLSGANVLILDEPTNHLDLESITSLNNALIKFPGAIFFTSHDHQFTQTVATRIIEFRADGVYDRVETYDEYLEKHELNQDKK